MRFGSPNSTCLYKVQKEIFNMALGGLSISTYFTRFKKLWDEYLDPVEAPKCATCGTETSLLKVLGKQQVLQFLVGLPDSYNGIRTSILLMRPTPNIADVYRMLLDEESQRGLNNVGSVSENVAAFNSFQRSGNRMMNSYGNQGGNWSNGNTTGQNMSQYGNQKNGNQGNQGNQNKGKGNYYCDQCKITCHSLSRCFKIHGYPPNFKGDKGNGSKGKFAGNVTVDDGDQESAPALTKGQYEKILAFLSKQSNGEDVNMTSGPFNEQATGSW